jgi:hypothetical protein
MIDKELLGMIISNLIFEHFGLGPSKSICDPFAGQVIAEASAINFDLEVPGRPCPP